MTSQQVSAQSDTASVSPGLAGPSPQDPPHADTDFYRQLPAVTDFSRLLQLDAYQPVPDSWFVLMADVVDSTGAIQADRYQEVNTLGASCIIAVLNACDAISRGQCRDPQTGPGGGRNQQSRRNIAYIFGGDGATFCIPPCYLTAALSALKGTAEVSQNAYQLELRTGCISVKQLRRSGHELLISKMQIGDNAWQAAFAGSGISQAEQLLKEQPQACAIGAEIPARADFTGLQCRWDRIPSPKEETVSLLIESRCQNLDQQSRLYRKTLAKITEIYGDREQHHPLQANGMHLTLSADKLRAETRLYSSGKSLWYKLAYGVKIRLIALMGSLMMSANMVVNGYNWGSYKEDMIRHSDHRKFDNMLRMVVAGTPQQRAELEHWLQRQHKKGLLYYGLSTSEAALLTCLVFQHGHDHFHFVDGADGGYALAASHLKQQKYPPPKPDSL